MILGATIPAGYNNFYMNPNGTCNTSPLANTSAGPNGGVPVNAFVSGGFVSFNFDLTQYFPTSSIEDINVTSLYDPATGSELHPKFGPHLESGSPVIEGPPNLGPGSE